MSTPTGFQKEYDDSPPRNGIIFFYSVLTVFLLIGVKFMLDSYFVKTMDAEVHDKVLSRGLEQVATMRAQEREALEQSGIGTAIKTIAQRGRTASPLIAPKSGAGQAEVQGWTKLNRKVEAAAESAPVVEAEEQPEAADVETTGPGNNPEEGKPASSVNPHGR